MPTYIFTVRVRVDCDLEVEIDADDVATARDAVADSIDDFAISQRAEIGKPLLIAIKEDAQ